MFEQAGIHYSNKIFRKVFPIKEEDQLAPQELEALAKIYMKWEVIALLFFFVYWPATGFLWYLLLQFVGDFAAQSHEPCVILEVPFGIFWVLPAVFLGIPSTVVPLAITFKILLGDRYEEYMRWSNQRQGFDAWKVLGLMTVLFVMGSVFWMVGSLRLWEEFHEDRVVIMRPWYWSPRTYPYARVKTIAHFARSQAPNGNILDNPRTVIKFDDGMTWSTRNRIAVPDQQREADIINLVSTRSGRPILQLDIDE
jgi:hypothetical protein